MTHARRQQYRHLGRSAGYALSAGLILLIAVSASRRTQEALMVFAFLLLGAGLGWEARRSQRLADRWRVGADSERAVQHALNGLSRRGWVVQSGVRWPGGGDIDHLVRSPEGVGFAIETKTRTFREAHLRRTAATARWAARRRGRYSGGVVPVVCVVRARRLESRDGDVLIVSLDRLLVVVDRVGRSTGCPQRPNDVLSFTPPRARVASRNDG